MTALVVKVMTGIGVMRTLDTGGDGGVIGNAANNFGPAGSTNKGDNSSSSGSRYSCSIATMIPIILKNCLPT